MKKLRNSMANYRKIINSCNAKFSGSFRNMKRPFINISTFSVCMTVSIIFCVYGLEQWIFWSYLNLFYANLDTLSSLKNFPQWRAQSNLLTPLTLVTLAFLLIMFTRRIMSVFYRILSPPSFVGIHPRHNKTAWN